ncbi:MAG: efflux RND transporter periplasmic adaptor subunit [Sphingomonadales bacterium]|nr:efflux RND transporter periplasmic adaptor subunit [Sphingomonadales bacterium]
MKKLILIPLSLGVAACSSNGSEDTAPEPSALVKIETVGTAAIADTMTIYGEVERGGASQAVLAAPVEATVVEIVAPPGSAVGAGDLVARLRASPASAAELARAGADADAAGKAYARAVRLRSDGLASDAEVETARAAADGSAALSRSLRQRQSALMLRAPHAGFVDSVGASPGDLIQPGAAVATIARGDGLRARFGISPAVAAQLTRGAAIEIEPGGGLPSFHAAVESVSPVADQQSKLATLIVRIPPSAHLASGTPLSARLQLGAAERGVTVAYAALLDDAGQPFVFAVRSGKAHRQDVVMGASDGKRVAIAKGLKPGDQIVVEGNAALEDGVKVRTK